MIRDKVIKRKVRVGRTGANLGVPAPQLGHRDGVLGSNAVACVARLDLVEAVTGRGNTRHNWGYWLD